MTSDNIQETDRLKEMEEEILSFIQTCINCRMCVPMCPTYEGWVTQSAFGRLAAINLHLKYGLGTEEELSRLLFDCATCRRCQERCKMLSTNVTPTDVIIKTRQLLARKALAKERDGS
ncbi:MAG: (Fe-S)-binding protein [Desulfobacteraceae bacterium]|jgi:heterodisulfide reductase subunit C